MIDLFFTGQVVKVGDNIDTDAILPARYLSLSTERELGTKLMEDFMPGLAGNVEPGSILVAGKNFGCGSSREHAPVAIRGSGFSCVVAESFSRIFFRNAINIGLPVLSVAGAASIPDDCTISVDCLSGRVEAGKLYSGTPLSGFVLEILSSGGLISFLRHSLANG